MVLRDPNYKGLGRPHRPVPLSTPQRMEALQRLHFVQEHRDKFRGLFSAVADETGYTPSMVSQTLRSSRVINASIIDSAYNLVVRELGVDSQAEAEQLGANVQGVTASTDARAFLRVHSIAKVQANLTRDAILLVEGQRTILSNMLRKLKSQLEPMMDAYTLLENFFSTHPNLDEEFKTMATKLLFEEPNYGAVLMMIELEQTALKNDPAHTWGQHDVSMKAMHEGRVPERPTPVSTFVPNHAIDTETDEEYRARIKAKVSASMGRPMSPLPVDDYDPDMAALAYQKSLIPPGIRSGNTGPDIAAILANTTPDPAIVAEAKALGRKTAPAEPTKQD